MKGIELSRLFYETYGKPMLSGFPELLPHLAVGVGGSGSEWLGFDDEISRDHDFEPGFTVFLPDESVVSRRDEFLLERAYQKLPREFMGYKRDLLSPAGGNRFGVRRMTEFFESTVGDPTGLLSLDEWLMIPEQYLLEATNGAVFYDGNGEFTAKKESLRTFPEDVRLKKLAGCLVTAGQSGPYNFERSVLHGESGAAQLSLSAFTESVLHAAFLLERKYMPFYKWSFRAARELQRFSPHCPPKELAELLEFLLTHGNDEEMLKRKRGALKRVVTELDRAVRTRLSEEGYSFTAEGRTYSAANPYRMERPVKEDDVLKRADEEESMPDLGRTAELVNGLISDAALRNEHILRGV